MSDEKPWSVSTDEERWTDAERYATEADAIADGPAELGLDDGDVFYVGRIVPFVPSVDPEFVIDQAACEACDEIDPDIIGDWPGIKSDAAIVELGNSLTHVFRQWLERHKASTIYGVDDVSRHVYEADAAGAER